MYNLSNSEPGTHCSPGGSVASAATKYLQKFSAVGFRHRQTDLDRSNGNNCRKRYLIAHQRLVSRRWSRIIATKREDETTNSFVCFFFFFFSKLPLAHCCLHFCLYLLLLTDRMRVYPGSGRGLLSRRALAPDCRALMRAHPIVERRCARTRLPSVNARALNRRD